MEDHGEHFGATGHILGYPDRETKFGECARCGGNLTVGHKCPPWIVDQPDPKPNGKPAVWDLVIADMQARDRVGRQRYGTPLQAHNGRDALVDAYQEALDLAAYLRQAIFERDAR